MPVHTSGKQRHWGSAIASLIAATGINSPVIAQVPRITDGEWGGSLGAGTDHIAYGLSHSLGAGVLQADLHYRALLNRGSSEAFIGVHTSTLDSGALSDGAVELDFYAGHSWRLTGRSSATLTYVHYVYPGESRWLNYDYDEIAGTFGFADRLFATVAWSPTTTRYTEHATPQCCRVISYEFEAHQPLKSGFTLTAGVGYSDLHAVTGYAFWNAGISRMLGSVQLDVSYFGTDSHAEWLFGNDAAGERWAISALWRFGRNEP